MITLQVGDKAPAFTGVDQNGNAVALKDYKGKKLALYFYPEDNTPTCTDQACNLRDNYSILEENGIVILGVSPDNEMMHKKFEEKFHLPFRLIADTKHILINKYGVWGPKQLFAHKYMGLHRTTFLIDEKGKIKHIIARPKSKKHAEEIIKAFSPTA